MAARVKGLERLNAKLRALRDQTAAALKPAMGEAAEVVVAMQKHLVPVDTGRLRDSIQWNFGDPPQGAKLGGGPRSENPTRVSITAGSREAYYAPFVEFGTKSHPAQPFFYPGYRATKKRAKAIIAKGVRTAVKAAAR